MNDDMIGLLFPESKKYTVEFLLKLAIAINQIKILEWYAEFLKFCYQMCFVTKLLATSILCLT